MKRYFLRSVRYFLFVLIVFTLIFTIMNITGHSQITPDMLGQFFQTQRSIMMSLFMLVLILIHPFISYVKRPLGLDINTSRSHVVSILAEYGYIITSENDEQLVFNQRAAWRRLLSPYDDTIVIDKKTFPSMIEGNRKAIVRITLRVKP